MMLDLKWLSHLARPFKLSLTGLSAFITHVLLSELMYSLHVSMHKRSQIVRICGSCQFFDVFINSSHVRFTMFLEKTEFEDLWNNIY